MAMALLLVVRRSSLTLNMTFAVPMRCRVLFICGVATGATANAMGHYHDRPLK